MKDFNFKIPFIGKVFGMSVRGSNESGQNNAIANVKGRGQTEIMLNLISQYTGITKQDMNDWRDSVLLAKQYYSPQRYMLIRQYNIFMIDNHLTSIIESREMKVLRKKIKLVDESTGEEDEEKTALLQRPWFRKYQKEYLNSKFLGLRLLYIKEFKDGEIQCMDLVNPEHVDPINALILKTPVDSEGLSYKDSAMAPWMLPVGDPEDLGLLMKAAPEVIWKKNARAAWADYAEIFGLPIRVAKTTSKDPKDLAKIEDQLVSMGRAAYALIPEGTEIDFKETKRSDVYEIFDKLTDRCNSEMSKLIQGQTGTTDEKSFVGSAKVHEGVADNYENSDSQDLLFDINFNLIPFLNQHGYGLDGLVAKYDDNEVIRPKDKIKIDKMVSDMGFKPTREYIEKTYAIELDEVQEPTEKEKDPNFKKPLPAKGGVMSPQEARINGLYFHAHAGELHIHAQSDLTPEERSKLDQISQQLMKSLYDGDVPKNRIALELYEETNKILYDGLVSSWGLDFGKIDYNTPDNAMLAAMRANIFAFGGAKSLAQIQEMKDLLIDKDGKVKTFSQYKQDVLKVDANYNTNWLRAERDQAIASAQGASTWLQMWKNREALPYGVYRTAGDDRVRPKHAVLDDFKAPLTDPVWQSIMPPNDWGCRCDVEQTDAPDGALSGDQAGQRIRGVITDPMFKNNPGMTGIVYKDDHPYFDNHGNYNELSAVKNYGMRSQKEIYADPTKLAQLSGKIKTDEDLKTWWSQQAHSGGTGKANEFVKENLFGRKLLFDADLLKKTMSKSRLNLADQIPAMITDPDEVFTVYVQSKKFPVTLDTVYIKYYEDYPVILLTEADADGIIRVKSFYNVDQNHAENFRRGILEYRKK
jgi:SPP1 gp7 family putative phage head morphogenesis protein